MPKRMKSFRLSEATQERLEKLAQNWELPQTAVIEQLVKREWEKISKNSRKKS